MVSDKLMKEYLDALPSYPLSMQEICTKLNRPESNVRQVLKVLMGFGKIKKVNISRKGNGKKPIKVGWVKVD